MVGRYGALYHQWRPRALEALDALPDLGQATQLKAKILFSIVVVSEILYTVTCLASSVCRSKYYGSINKSLFIPQKGLYVTQSLNLTDVNILRF